MLWFYFNWKLRGCGVTVFNFEWSALLRSKEEDKLKDRCCFKREMTVVTRSLLQRRPRGLEAAPSRCASVSSLGPARLFLQSWSSPWWEGEERRLTWWRHSGVGLKLPAAVQVRSEDCPGSGVDSRARGHSPWAGPPRAAPQFLGAKVPPHPRKAAATRQHAPERGPPRPCALGVQALRGHRLQPAFDHHQGRCFLFFCCK